MRNSNGKIFATVDIYKLFEISIKVILTVISSEIENYQHGKLQSMVQLDFFNTEIKSTFIIKMTVKRQHYA